jgi:hypothetical protein
VGNATVTVALAAVASVTISLPKSTIAVGEAIQATATLRDANNNVLTGRTVTWSSGNSAIVTVSSSGQVQGIALGTANVVATSGGVNGTTGVTVSAPVVQGPAPEPGGSDVVLWQDGFESRSTSGYATRGNIVVINDGHSGSALRFPYSPSSDDQLIEKVFATSTDVYFRYWYRTSPGMDPTCGDRGGSGMKWFMAWRASGVRYTMGVGTLSEGPLGRDNLGNEFASHDNGSSRMPNPVLSDVNNNIRLSTTNDGQWHKYTLHIVTSNGDGTGYEQIWIDGVLVLDDQAARYDHNPEGIAMVNFPGLVVNWYSGCDFTIDVDDLAIWHK